MDNEQARSLLKKYNSGDCTEAERVLVEDSFLKFNEQDIEISFKKLEGLKKQSFKNLPKPQQGERKLKAVISISIAAAAIAIALYLFLPTSGNEIKESLVLAEKILPKGNVAFITLSNGKTIKLNPNRDEITAKESSLTYRDGSSININNSSEYQTISTPRGGEYKIVLSDGTKVWLNAATVLQYPASFRERTERRVKLVSGEAYFEVAKDKSHPFIVVSRNQNLTVLGTHFNINTYEGTVKTTLLEGAVKLNSTNKIDAVRLLPGEESVTNGRGFQKSKADINLNLAWKNGKLKFRDKGVKSILKDAERWYDIKVEYKNTIPDIHLTGGISRKSSLATLLKLLQMSGIEFTLKEEDGNKILYINP